MTTVGRQIVIKNGQGTPPPLEVAEFGLKTNTNNEELYIGSNSGNIKVLTERDASSITVNVVDNLTSTSSTSALSAYQGKILKDMIDAGGGSGGSNAVQKTGDTMNGRLVNEKKATNDNSWSSANIEVRMTDSSPTSEMPRIALHSSGAGVAKQIAGDHIRGGVSVLNEDGQSLARFNCGEIWVNGVNLKQSIDSIMSGGGGGGTIANIFQDAVTTGSTGTAFGALTYAMGQYSYTEGYYNYSSGKNAHSQNYRTVASGDNSHSSGSHTEAKNYASHAIGYNSDMTLTSATNFYSTADAFVIGNGTSDTSTSNAFRVKFDGSVYGRSAYNSSGADYAEYFEWSDGNVDNEDRVGYFVTLDGDKIRKANAIDTYILGVISANASVIGNSSSEGWNEQYVRDEFGRVQYHYVDVKHEELDENGEKVTVIKNEYHPIYNPQYDPSLKYVPREDRPEWDAVGMVGILLVRDDGTCKPNGYCSPNNDGIATKSDEGYRVMKRVSDNIIQVLVK